MRLMAIETAEAATGSELPDSPARPRHLLLARIMLGIFIVGTVGSFVIAYLDTNLTGEAILSAEGALGDVGLLVAFSAFPLIGFLLAVRRPDNSIGWVMLGMGVFMGLPFAAYGTYAIHGGPGGRDLGLLFDAIDQPMWIPVVAIPATFLLLLFPNGHLPSPRWRWFARILGWGLVFIFLVILFSPGPIEGGALPGAQNPLGLDSLRPFLGVAFVSILVIPIGAVGSLVSLVQRFRRSRGIERLQLRWLVTAATIVAATYAAGVLFSLGGEWTSASTTNPEWLNVLQTVSVLSFALIPIAIGASILRYHLFDIDVVINRALLVGALAVFIAVVYVAIVAGVGAVVGGQASPLLSAGAAGVVALAFQPARRSAQRFADRLVYGKRATPYEVLSEFSERVGNTYASDELLPRMARALGEGTGAVRADVWVRVGDELRPEAAWPEDADGLSPRPARADEEEGTVTASSMFEPVRHRGDLLGALSMEKRPGESLTATEEKLVRDLAAQAGLVLRNAGLTEDLRDTIEQLRASRQRLVAAQDEERRRLERNLHDGAQQQLVALAVKLRLLEQLVERDPAQARSVAAQLQGDTTEALEELRDLARGIYPPLLADKGLVAALESQARKSVVPVAIEADGVGRYARETEAAVYFSCLEALQNVAKYASASHTIITLADGDGRLRFEVSDDGVGFDAASRPSGTGLQGIADRLAALDGEIEIRSAPGAGTTVAGVLPVSGDGGASPS
jgi:signal transduction histidine kinase